MTCIFNDFVGSGPLLVDLKICRLGPRTRSLGPGIRILPFLETPTKWISPSNLTK
uniref:Uncharacterized protein n=1 Tax=Rhizophagus irregularis (strain DAOM 181602 / DAOM 197198 / MUCL 43194) TaxID=747089 RepID=U9T0J5_RHIID